MNYSGDDYVMGHLLRRARETQVGRLDVDVLARAATPSALLTREIGASVERYCDWFPTLIANHETEMRFVRSARLSLEFDLSTRRPVHHAPGLEESPYICRMEIHDDRGRLWSAEFRDWWFPESDASTSGNLRRSRQSIVIRFGQIIRSVWSRAGFIALAG